MEISHKIKDIKNKTPIPLKKFIKKLYKLYRSIRNRFLFSIFKKSIEKKHLISTFRELGIKKNDTILIHSSLSRIGKINGGAKTILEALLEIVGPNGNIGAPTFWGFSRHFLSG